MSYEKLAERDVNQFRFPFETVRLRMLLKILGIQISGVYQKSSWIRGVYKKQYKTGEYK